MATFKSGDWMKPTMDLDLHPLPTEKTLGIFWDSVGFSKEIGWFSRFVFSRKLPPNNLS